MSERERVVSLTRRRLTKNPITYTIIFRHGPEGMSFVVYDVQDTQRDRLAVARDLEAAAASLREAGE
jgi:hypothetical protein